MIYFENVSKKFQVDFWSKPFMALDGVSFEVPKNQIVGFLGANGAGKTTSLKIALNFIRPTAGQVRFDEELGKTRQEIISNIGYVPERPYFYPHLTGKEFIFYMGKLNALENKRIQNNIDKWANRLKIDFALDRKIQTYSKGMLQRLGFVSCLIHDPKLVILDEPVSGLDPVGRKEIKDVIREINKEGKTVFFSSHIVPDVEEICDDVVFLEKGKLIYQGTVDKLIYDNMKDIFLVKYRKVGGDRLLQVEVPTEQKEEKLTELLKSGYEILSLGQEKLNLEEIFYKIKHQERRN